MDETLLLELLKTEEDAFDRAIICHQYGLAVGDVDLMDLAIWALQDAFVGMERNKLLEGISQCLMAKCNTGAASSRWSTYYIVSAGMLPDYSERIGLLESIIQHINSSSLRCLVSWSLVSLYSATGQIYDAFRCYRMHLGEEEEARLKQGKIYALFHLWAAVFACDWLLDDLQGIGCGDPCALSLWLYSKGEIAYVMGDFSDCLSFHQQAIAEAEKIKPRQNIREISGVHDTTKETRAEGYVRFIKNKARVSSVPKTAEGFDVEIEAKDVFLVPVLHPKPLLKSVKPWALGILSAPQIPLFLLLRQETNDLDRVVIQHQCAVAGGKYEGIASLDEELPSSLPYNSEPELLCERIIQCLVGKCKTEPTESKAWALFYVGTLLQGSSAKLCYLKQSLDYGKSPVVRYLASFKCDEISEKLDERLGYCLQQVKEADATMWIHAKICSLFRLWHVYDSLSRFREAREIQGELEKIGNTLAKGLSLFCQGKSASSVGNFSECISLHRQAISVLEKAQQRKIIFGIFATRLLFTTPMVVIAETISRALIDTWACQMLLGDDNKEELEAGRRRFQETILMKGAHSDELQNIYGTKFLGTEAYSLARNSKFEEAKAIWLTVLSFSRNRPDCLESYAEALVELVHIASSAGNLEEIESYFSEIKKVALHEGILRFVTEKMANAYFRMGGHKTNKAIENLKKALSMDMDAASNYDLSTMRISYIDFHKNVFRNMQALILQTSLSTDNTAIQKALVWAERERARDFLYSIQQKQNASYFGDVTQFDRNDTEAWRELRSISSLAGRDTVFIVISKPCNDGWYLHPTFSSAAMFTYFLRAGEAPLKGTVRSESGFKMPAFELRASHLTLFFKVFIGPWEQRLEKAEAKRIVFVTNEETALLPFAAFICSDGKFLIEKYEISTIASLRLFKYCEMRRRCLMENRHDMKALVVADPQSNLPYAKKEGEIVASILEDSHLHPCLLKGPEARKATVLSKLPASCWIHMACHTKFAANIPNGSLNLVRSQLCDMVCNFGALEFWDDETASVLSDSNETDRAIKTARTTLRNILTAEEIHEGKELRAVATILGACRSGTGQTCAEGTLGLARSFHLAGVPTVVASLWPVDDESASILMERFYKRLDSSKCT